MANYDDLAKDLNRNRVDALKIDVDAGLTFAKIALHASAGSEKQHRNRANARKAYESVTSFMSGLSFTGREVEEINSKLNDLKSALQQLGESFERSG